MYVADIEQDALLEYKAASKCRSIRPPHAPQLFGPHVIFPSKQIASIRFHGAIWPGLQAPKLTKEDLRSSHAKGS